MCGHSYVPLLCWWVNACYSGSIAIKITLLISPYKIFLNASNGHGCYFKNHYYFNIWIIHVQSFTKLPKSMWKLVFNVIDVNFLEVLKGKPTKSKRIMPRLKLFKPMLLGQRNWKTNKNCDSYGLMNIWSNFNHSKLWPLYF
jgi:hypothetical protein